MHFNGEIIHTTFSSFLEGPNLSERGENWCFKGEI